jgi:Flp pilus assembly pilin Flp
MPSRDAERGTSTVEYAFLAALVAAVIVLTLVPFGIAVAALFEVPWP